MKERPVLFGRNRNLVGVITEPTDRSVVGPAVLILNAGIIHRVGPNRLYVHTARSLAGAGYRVLRFDLSGIGDSARAAEEGTLKDIVPRDIEDAVDLVTQDDPEGGVVLMGLCSGADNSFYVAAGDPRVRGLVLIDPTIPRTRGFHRRRTLRRLGSLRSWWNVLSGRSLALRVRDRASGGVRLPPDYFGLLVAEPEQAAAWVRELTVRGVQFLYVITGGASDYCNSAAQVREAFDGFADNLRVEWKPDANHTMSREAHQVWLRQTLASWLSDVRARVAGQDLT